MKNKIKLVLSALIIQGCFFSSSLFAVTYNQGQVSTPDGWPYKTTYSSWVVDGVSYDTISIACGMHSMTRMESSPYPYCYFEDPAYLPQGYSYVQGISNSYSLTCAEGEVPSGDGGTATCQVYVDPCASKVDTQALQVTQAQIDSAMSGDSTFDINGCSYAWSGTAQCLSDSDCLVFATGSGTAITGNGVSCDAESVCQTYSETTYTPLNPLTFFVPALATALYDKISDTVVNGDNSITDTTTEITQAQNDAWDNITYDGEYFIELSNSGTTSTTTDVSVTTTQVDGSSTDTTTSTTQTSSGATETTVTNAADSTSNTSTTPSVTTTTTETTVTEKDVTGETISQEITSDTVTEEPTDPNALACGYADNPDCVVKIDDEGVSTDATAFNGSVDGMKGAPSTSGISTPSLSLSLGTSAVCNPSDYTITVLNNSFTLDICFYIDLIQSILFWLFNVFTVWFIYSTITARRGV